MWPVQLIRSGENKVVVGGGVDFIRFNPFGGYVKMSLCASPKYHNTHGVGLSAQGLLVWFAISGIDSRYTIAVEIRAIQWLPFNINKLKGGGVRNDLM
jgi:hypothetical protein